MNYALFVEYEGILLGNTQKFSQLSLTRLREKTTAKQILRFIFEELLEWTPEQVRDYLTPQIAEKLHLTRIVHQIDFPCLLQVHFGNIVLIILFYNGDTDLRVAGRHSQTSASFI